MEIAAAALQFTSAAVQAFRGCILAIEFFNTAQHMGADGDLFRTGLEFEKYRLVMWADRVGLLNEKERQTINWQLAGLILQQLESFLTSAAELKTRYALDVMEEEVEAAEEAQAAEAPKRGVAALIARLKPNLRTTAGKIIQENNSPIRRVRWAARDRGKLKAFLHEISALVDKLQVLLDSSERQAEKHDYEKLLRGVISLTTTTAEAGQIKEFLEDGPYNGRRAQHAINAAAYLKQVRLVLGADRRDDEVTPKLASDTAGLKMPRLSILGRSLTSWGGASLYEHNLEFATYHKKQVLVQWKLVPNTQWERYTTQMKRLAVFIMSLSDKSFRSLPCLGYYPLEAQGRHGIIYSLPTVDRDSFNSESNATDWDLRSLTSLIKEKPLVSLRRRLELASSLAETVLQLHTAGWLHKNLRSENIIFLAPRGSSDEVFLASELYVIGYEYARSDTEEAAIAFTQLPDTEIEADLYRHPQARGHGRETYQKRFDLYAVACVVIELVMWSPLADVFAEYLTANLREVIDIAKASGEVIELPTLGQLFENEEATRALRYQAGDAVFEVIKMCYTAERRDQEDETSLAVQNAAVDKLAWCRI
ncbi:prion-inhibition and propagation-domain-containing protein [Echria macrotheca]|uniref:Prion-inhibition and propagation-domain-containing protein n=1 Tax=Echria macrotheca TaxID=438768 RepID=A0AAJ0BL74_9PEZI|nr:prion-inhibition and propagation-domain-containing protein [Echria macrotheca]